jgi:cytochrome c peroxidase
LNWGILLALLPPLLGGAASHEVARDILHVPKGFPMPDIPVTNPLTVEKVLLGRYLFYDKRMSLNRTFSCGSCHKQELAFTDGLGHARGATGETHPRSAMTLVNVAWNRTFNWGDTTVHSLEEQVLKPMMGIQPVELGFGFVEKQFLDLVESDGMYRNMFMRAFPGESRPWTTANIAKAIASFERTIISGNSPWDRFHFYGEDEAISESAKRGEQLFFLSGVTECFHCHAGFNFSDAVQTRPVVFHNTGLYSLPGKISYPDGGRGVYEDSHRPQDVGMFKTPTLRNVAVTGPYMHDGSASTLYDVIDHYVSGGRVIATGENAGNGNKNPLKDKLVHGFPLTRQNRTDLIAFLQSLTDRELLTRKDLSDPWEERPASTHSRN